MFHDNTCLHIESHANVEVTRLCVDGVGASD